jgi:hypothetical protein
LENDFSSVIAGDPLYFFAAALHNIGGTIWSFSPEVMSNGPLVEFFTFTLFSEFGFSVANATWKSGRAGEGTV